MKANEKTDYKCCICDETATHFLSTHDGAEASCFAVCDDCHKLDDIMADYEMTDDEAIVEAARAAGYPESKQPKLSEWLEDYCARCLACSRIVYEWCTCIDNTECHECFERLHTY